MDAVCLSHCYKVLSEALRERRLPWPKQIITPILTFGGPYPDGHYNLVAVDLRSRYPVVETISSTSFKATREELKKIFATYGIPRKIQSDNGPPFNSEDFRRFAEEEGFKHETVTPLHPRANREAESFMKVINKTADNSTTEQRQVRKGDSNPRNTNCIQINTTSSNGSNTIPGNAEQRNSHKVGLQSTTRTYE